VLGKMRKPAVIGQRFVTFCEWVPAGA